MVILTELNRLVTCAGVEESSYRKIKAEVHESNRKSLFVFSIVATVFLLIMFLVSFSNEELANNTQLYGVSALIMAVIAVLSNSIARKREVVTLTLMYVFMVTLLFFGIELGTVFSPTEITATFIALMLTAPQVFTDRPYRMYLLITGSVTLFIFMCLKYKDPSVFNSDIINSIVFGLVSMIVCTYTNGLKLKRYCLEDTIRLMAETDQLTGLKNRTSYEIQLERISILDAASFFCVYVDANGLHELNNTQGHDAGDRMLQYVAAIMQNMFGENTFRIGGDEFVAFGVDRCYDEVNCMIEDLKKAAELGGYSVAVGMDYRPKKEIEVDGLIKQAEKNMFADKEEYYRKNGIEHRRKGIC